MIWGELRACPQQTKEDNIAIEDPETQVPKRKEAHQGMAMQRQHVIPLLARIRIQTFDSTRSARARLFPFW